MKPIIIDINDMSDSTEVYESRPHPFYVIFIYLLLIIVCVAVGWMYISKIDIVIKATGTVEMRENVSTITNTAAGKILKDNIEDGQFVKKDEVLYIINHDELDKQLGESNSLLADIDERLNIAKEYLAWLKGDDNNFELMIDNIYYDDYEARKTLIELNCDSVSMNSKQQNSQYQVLLDNANNNIVYYENQVAQSQKLVVAIKNRNNEFDIKEEYYYTAVVNYIDQYNSKSNEYTTQIAELTKTRDAASKQVSYAEIIINNENTTIEKAKIAIEAATGEITAAQLVINNTDGTDPNNANIILSAQTIISTQQDIITLETANILDSNSKIDAAKTQKDSQGKIISDNNEAIALNQNNRIAALSSLENETVMSVEAQILTYQKTLLSYQDNKNVATNNESTVTEDSVENNIANVKTAEKQAILQEIGSYNSQKQEIKIKRDAIEASIEKTTVHAPSTGVVNLNRELVEGDYLEAGDTVLTVIPQGEGNSYIVKAYIQNNDIAKITPGMKVKYGIEAYPESEYGTITGEILSVSNDVKISDEAGSVYYVALVSVNEDSLYNSLGEKATLKVGMLCNVKIVVEQKKVLYYLLEKIDMLD